MSGRFTTHHVLAQVAQERARQDAKWGVQDHDDTTWNTILSEEVGEVARAVLSMRFAGDTPVELENLREELIQVGAVAVAWVECIDRLEPLRLGLAVHRRTP